jgi:hypothetical protein
MSINLVRRLAWFAIAAQVLFVASWVVAGALEPGYSHIDRPISELGSAFAAHPWIANAGFVVLGLSIVTLAPGGVATLPARPARSVTAALLVFCGLAMGAMGFLHIECSFTATSCRDLFRAGELSWQTEVHVWLGLALQIALVATPFALARALWPRPAGTMALGAGLLGLGIGVAAEAWARADGAPDGLIERWELLSLQVGLILLAVGILHAARREPDPSPPIPLPPRDFFGSSWRGEGEVVLRPYFFWRRFPLRVKVSREPRWISDDCWVFEDRAVFANGWKESRRAYCELVAPDRVQVTAAHLPHGASVILDDDGFRMRPYQLLLPIGPLGVLFDCRDRSEMDPDGTFRQAIDLCLLGLAAVRVRLRVRPQRPDVETNRPFPASVESGVPG